MGALGVAGGDGGKATAEAEAEREGVCGADGEGALTRVETVGEAITVAASEPRRAGEVIWFAIFAGVGEKKGGGEGRRKKDLWSGFQVQAFGRGDQMPGI